MSVGIGAENRTPPGALQRLPPLQASPCSLFFFSSRRRHTMCLSDWSSDVCSSDLISYLNVQDHDRQRAVALASSVAKQLELALRRLRDSKAQSMVDELSKTVAVADKELSEATGRLEIGRAACREKRGCR